MKKKLKHAANYSTSELLILRDGRILVQNLTQPMAELLRRLDPEDPMMALRAQGQKSL